MFCFFLCECLFFSPHNCLIFILNPYLKMLESRKERYIFIVVHKLLNVPLVSLSPYQFSFHIDFFWISCPCASYLCFASPHFDVIFLHYYICHSFIIPTYPMWWCYTVLLVFSWVVCYHCLIFLKFLFTGYLCFVTIFHLICFVSVYDHLALWKHVEVRLVVSIYFVSKTPVCVIND